MAYRVHKSEKGDVIVRSKEDSFTACYKNGHWSDRLSFNAYELEELLQVVDTEEASVIIAKAKEAIQAIKSGAPANRKVAI
jgi:hypothetical protein